MSTDPAILVPPLDAQLIESVRAGKCILFLGAGVHYPPKDTDPNYGHSYPKDQQPPTGKALAKILADDSGLNLDADYALTEKQAIADNLQRISLYYEIKNSRKELVSKVKESVSLNKRPSRAVKALAELNFPIICTTNYDTLFDMALFQAGKTPIISSYSNQRHSITKDYVEDITPPVTNPFIFKIHSDVDDPTQSMVITDEDYIQFILRMITGNGQNDPIPRVFRSHMPIWPMLFIGFSLLDYNLRLLFQLLSWQLQAPGRSYSVGPYPDRLIRNKYEPPVRFIAQDVWAFVPELYRAVTGKPMP
jgi:hypothetical protein